MATVSISQPANNGDPMPDPVTGTIYPSFAAPPPAEAAAPPVGAVTVTFVRTDVTAPVIDVPAAVSGNSWSASSDTVPNGTYTVVATGSYGGSDPPGTDSRTDIHKP